MEDIGWAIAQMKQGKKVRRAGWAPKAWVAIQVPDDFSKMSLPYTYASSDKGELAPWHIGHDDLFAEDWQLAA